MFPPVTEREMALPWHHERFRLREGPDGPFMTNLGDKRSVEERERAERSRVSRQNSLEEEGLDEEAASQGGREYDAEAVELEGPLARALAVRSPTCWTERCSYFSINSLLAAGSVWQQLL